MIASSAFTFCLEPGRRTAQKVTASAAAKKSRRKNASTRMSHAHPAFSSHQRSRLAKH